MMSLSYRTLNDRVDDLQVQGILTDHSRMFQDRLYEAQRYFNRDDNFAARVHGEVLYITENLTDREAPCILISRNLMQHGSTQYNRQLRRGDVLIQVFDHGATDAEEALDGLGDGGADTRVWFNKEGRMLLC